MHAFDRQTDGHIDRILIARPLLHLMQRGKNQTNAGTHRCLSACIYFIKLFNAVDIVEQKGTWAFLTLENCTLQNRRQETV